MTGPTYQINMVTNSADGFTEEELEQSLKRNSAAAVPPLEVTRSGTDAMEVRGSSGLLVTLSPAGREPYDYLLVDFIRAHGWEGEPQIGVVAGMGEDLDLTVMELESGLEYTPREWAAIRGRYHSPDPARRTEARGIELEREIEFYHRRGLPYSDEEIGALRAAVAQPDDQAMQRSAQTIRDAKKREDRPAVPAHGNRYTDRSEGRIGWPFGRRRG